MKLKNIVLGSALMLALLSGGCAKNVTITTAINNSGKQDVNVNVESGKVQREKKYDYSYFYEADHAYILSDSRMIAVQQHEFYHGFMVTMDREEQEGWRNIEELVGIPESYKKEFYNYGNLGEFEAKTYGKVAVFYDPLKWHSLGVGGNNLPFFDFRDRAFENKD